jgi:hypothetical protein
MKGHLRQRGNAWELRAYVGVDPLTNRKKYLTQTFRGPFCQHDLRHLLQ